LSSSGGSRPSSRASRFTWTAGRKDEPPPRSCGGAKPPRGTRIRTLDFRPSPSRPAGPRGFRI
jgi:hypothetical protein